MATEGFDCSGEESSDVESSSEGFDCSGEESRSTENKANRARKEEKLQICRLAPVARDNDDCGEKFRKLSVLGVSNPRTRNILSLNQRTRGRVRRCTRATVCAMVRLQQ